MRVLFNDAATTEIYTLSLHDALPISKGYARTCHSSFSTGLGSGLAVRSTNRWVARKLPNAPDRKAGRVTNSTVPFFWPMFQKDRKSTRLNSSHANISYAVFCLEKKKT